jgi:hypothetical protein
MQLDLSEIFAINYKEIQIHGLKQNFSTQFGNESYFNEAKKILAKSNK